MPELPEVEVVKQSLNKKIREKKVKKVLVRNRNLRKKVPSKFEKFFLNQKILKVGRFSKYLIYNIKYSQLYNFSFSIFFITYSMKISSFLP